MTIAASAFDHVGAANMSSVATNSKTWTSGNLYIVTVFNFLVAGPNVPTCSGLTSQGTFNSVADSREQFSVFSFLGDGATNAKTVDFGGVAQAYIEIIVDEVTGTKTTGTNASDAFVQVVFGDTGSPGTTGAVTLASFGSASNATWFAVNNGTPAQPQPKAGYTALSESAVTFDLRSEYKASSDTAPNMTWTGSGFWVAAGIELAIGGTDVTLNPTGFGLAVSLGTPTVNTGAISIAAFDHVGGANVSSLDTNVKTWIFNRLYLVTVYDFLGVGGPVLPTIAGMTQQGTRLSVSDSRQRATLFSFLGDGTTSAKTIDLSGGTFNPTYIEVVVDEAINCLLTGTNGTDAFVQVVGNDGGPSSTFDATLATFSNAANATWFAVGNGTGAATPKAGFTALSESNVNLVLDSEYLASPDTAPNMTNGAAFWTALGVELATSSGGGSGTVTPVGFGLTTTEGLLDVEIDTNVLPVGYALTASRGVPTISIVNGGSSNITLTPIGFGNTVSLGTPVVQADTILSATGFGLTISEGTPAISGPVTIVSPTGFSITASVGTPSTTSTHLLINPVGFGLTVLLGQANPSGKTVQLNCLMTSGDWS